MAYWAEVRAEGPVYGMDTATGYVLGTYRTISPVLALRWIRAQASWIAERIDPDPARSRWARCTVREEAVPLSDAPTELRAWGAESDPVEDRAARAHLKAGFPLSVVAPDADCVYTFSVWPERLPSRPGPQGPPPRLGGFAHPVYVLTPRCRGESRRETTSPVHT
ncbi:MULTISPECIES: hypothetical protein [Streptomyces]|uniref:hypothetical protein n=1 Tax=Streptomyces TaxID=1883 RepID=UPI0022495421|nr:hypothetical protein [Streptomyces sp. JHD 1]MCX2971150.1 hypothetical protein [Streptomyces sp. JHD 1]